MFAVILRCGIGGLLAVAALRAMRRPDSGYYLRFVLGATLFGVALAAWPLFYLVLQSYVGQWPGVMCIDGVTRVGTGSANSAAHLPGLVSFLEISKPTLIFVAGVWVVFHTLLRSRVDPRIRLGSTVSLLALGLLGVVDGAAEGAYLFIPKTERALATGCCTVGSQLESFAPLAPVDRAGGVPPLAGLFFGLSLAVIVSVSVCLQRMHLARTPGRWLAVALVGAVALVPIGAIYLRTVAAPLFLRLPYHECAYCLVGSAPESLL
ncbi:MAG: hypothetical protein ACYTEG_16145, partial [Planctomycetota bacterium]